MPEVTGLAPGKARKLVLHGIAWTSFSQVCQALFGFVAMLVLVRIIPAAEYGRAAAVVGFLAVINIFSCRVFIRSALQLPAGVEPDWSGHWSAAMYLQALLVLACNALAGLFWISPRYRPIAPLMHIASIGIAIDWFNQMRVVMLERQMNFRRQRILYTISSFCSVAVAVALGVGGAGAYAIVISGNVIAGAPFAVDLLFVSRWRPRPGWWRMPDWREYKQSLRFGLQQSGSTSLFVARGGLESALLTPAVGFTAMGLWSRGQALYTLGAGKISAAIIETVYPLLPRYASDKENYPRQATLFAQVMLWFLVPAAFYMGIVGPLLSRIVYGMKWVAADPLIWPGALIGMGLACYTVGNTVLLATNRLRSCFYLDLMCAAVTLPSVLVVLTGRGVVVYAWTAALAQTAAAFLALSKASSLFVPGWRRVVLLPTVLATAVSSVCAIGILRNTADSMSRPIEFILVSAVYLVSYLAVLRFGFPETLEQMLLRVPGGTRIHRRLYGQRATLAAQA